MMLPSPKGADHEPQVMIGAFWAWSGVAGRLLALLLARVARLILPGLVGILGPARHRVAVGTRVRGLAGVGRLRLAALPHLARLVGLLRPRGLGADGAGLVRAVGRGRLDG